MKKLFGLLKSRWLISLVGLLAVCLLIYYGGPYLAIAKREPFASPTSRWIAIAVAVAVWIAVALWRHRRDLLANALLLTGLAARGEEPPPSASEQASREEVDKLRKRMEEALALLKKTRLKGRFGGQYVYQLPWYVMIGAPASGKTTALLNSGLKFPLASRLGTREIKGVGGTRNCDWLFTDEAVLLDTAGRFLTQDSNRDIDRAAWAGFLDLLKRYRRRRPINGVIVAISIADLQRLPQSERQLQAEETRQRLEELHRAFGIRFPVYVLFTKCDLLAGFMEFFSDLGSEDRAQVWGTTFGLSETSAHADALASLPADLMALERRIADRMLKRLQDERNAPRRALIYAFPQQFSAVREAATEYLKQVFQLARGAEQAMVRGVFFTSGTQEGTPIDRVLNVLAKSMGVSPSAPPAHSGEGKSFFITRLLRDVIFAEQGLAGANLKLERRRAWLQTAAYAGIGVLALLIIMAWAVSYRRNAAYVADVDKQVERLKPQLSALSGPAVDLAQLLPVVDAVRALPGGYADQENGLRPPLGFGLDQTEMLGTEAQDAYYRLLKAVLLPAVAQRMEERLRDGRGDYGYRFDLLKAYLMLTRHPERFDLAFIQNFAKRDWQEHSGSVLPEMRARLAQHTAALFQNPFLERSDTVDAALVKQTREHLAAVPRERRLYERLKELPTIRELEEFSPTKDDINARWVLTRKSGAPLDKGIPGLFTKSGYARFNPALDEIVRAELEDAWVLGEPPDRAKSNEAVMRSGISALYFQEYVGQWRVLLADYGVAPFTSPADAATKLQRLSSPESPLRKLLKAAAEQTTLTPPPEKDKGLGDKAKEMVLGSEAASEPTPVDKEFAPVHRMVNGEGGKAPLDATLELVDAVSRYMKSVEDVVGRGEQIPPGGDEVIARVRAEAPRQPLPMVRDMLQSIAGGTAGLVQRGNYAKFDADWRSSVLPVCQQAILGRYPVKKASTEDVALNDFGQLFGHDGKIDKFFQSVRPFLDTSRKPWGTRSMGQASLPISRTALNSLQHADDIRSVFFSTDRTSPSVSFDLTPLKMDKSIALFTLDWGDANKKLRYDHGPQRPETIKWPATGGRQEARVEISPAGPRGSGIGEKGPWALLKLLDAADIQPTKDRQRYYVTFTVDGKKIVLELRAHSAFNPFTLAALQNFKCPEHL